jgi:hypothetical protein
MIIKGFYQFRRFLNGETLSRKDVILAHCFMCGLQDGPEDCLGTKSCPLYQYFPYRGKNKLKNGGFHSGKDKENGSSVTPPRKFATRCKPGHTTRNS